MAHNNLPRRLLAALSARPTKIFVPFPEPNRCPLCSQIIKILQRYPFSSLLRFIINHPIRISLPPQPPLHFAISVLNHPPLSATARVRLPHDASHILVPTRKTESPQRHMTRLVGVRAVCDGCSSAAAAVFCVFHRAVYCIACDTGNHSSPTSRSHQRVDLASAVTALPFCEYCDDAPATTYCESEGITFCDKCDRVVHASHSAPAHGRTPISSTLRNRAVEFRGLPSNRTTSEHHHSRSSSPPRTASRKSKQTTTHKNDIIPSQSLSRPPVPPQTSQTTNPSPPQTSAPRTQASPKRRSSKFLTKRKYRRPSQRPVSSITPLRFPPGNTPHAHSSAGILQSGDYPGLLFPVSNVSAPYPPFGADNPVSAPPSDPLMADQNPCFQALHDRHESAGASPLTNELNLFSYGSMENLDLSGDTALDGVNGSGKDSSGSGSSSRRKTPDFELFHHQNTPRPPPNTPQVQPAPNVTVVAAAAAAAAAGEQYLLNSVSSGSGSPRERRISPPLNDVGRVPDPAGVAEAATAAAESAAAAVDMGGSANAAEAPGSTKGSRLSTDVGMHGMESASGRLGRSQHVTHQLTDAFLSESGAPGRATFYQTQQSRRQRLDEATLDEAMRRLDNDTGTGASRNPKTMTSGEQRLHRSGQERLTRDGNAGVLGQMPDESGSEILTRGGSDVMEDLDMPGNEFGMLDSLDLSQFDQHCASGLGYPLSD